MQNSAVQKLKESMLLPVIMAPMFLVSNPNMVINACKAGIIGSFPVLNARTTEILEEWMIEITSGLESYQKQNPGEKAAPWAVNFISHHTNKRYESDLALIGKYQPPLVITSLGDPSPVVKVVHQYGGVVFSDVINTKFAKKAIEKGSDGLILVSNGAGGHGGEYNPFAFVHEVRDFWDGPIVLAGGMSKGEDILAAEILGADFVYMGTRFITAQESYASDTYKKMTMESTIEDIIYTDAFSGVNANYLIPSIVRAGLDPAKLQSKKEIDFSELDAGVKAWKDIWSAGQGVGAVKEIQPVAEIVGELKAGYEKARLIVIER